MAIDLAALRHPKEQRYFLGVALVGGGLFLTFALMTALVGPLLLLGGLWLAGLFFRASIYGNAVKVSPKQYPQIHQMVQKASADLGLKAAPETFVFNADGMVNAFAVKFLKGQYVLLTAPSVELLLERGHPLELAALVGHELGHHAAGHTAWWKGMLTGPCAIFAPVISSAYSRACELTCDRIGAAVAGDPRAMQTALVAIAAGSRVAPLSVEAFAAQEGEVPKLAAFIQELSASHPRTTLRVQALGEAAAAGLIPRRKVNFGPSTRPLPPGRPGTAKVQAGPPASGRPSATPEPGLAGRSAPPEAASTAPLPRTEAPGALKEEAWPSAPEEGLWGEADPTQAQVASWTSPTGELFERVEPGPPPPSRTVGSWEG